MAIALLLLEWGDRSTVRLATVWGGLAMLKVAVGHSDDPISQLAAKDVVEQCRSALAGHDPQVGLLFAAIDFEHDLILDTILGAFPNMMLVGCTTDGEVSSTLSFQQDSLVLMVFASDTLHIGVGLGRNLAADVTAAAQEAIASARASIAHPPQDFDTATPALCLAFPESLTLDSATIVATLQQALGDSVPLLGGFAGDQSLFKKTYQFYGHEVLTDALPIVLFYGDLKLSHGVAHGWTPIGAVGEITRTAGPCLQEIDHKPALDFYQYYMNDLVPSTEFPLAIFDEGEGDRYYLRVSIGYDQQEGSLQAVTHWPLHSNVQIARASRDEILAGAQASMQQAVAHFPGHQIEAVLLFSCCVRRNLLGTRTLMEHDLVQQGLDQPVCTAGFYTYGEIAPLAPQTAAKSHHATFVTLLLGTL
ncbi:FIST signal transduction protein [Leptolyngbya sp. AN02str]|uniref:FIST signal transduction protein n=1 Tax=Leptolyngbya sp. AN02str TaxID=3423363 RepID=UPI003D31519E